MPAFKKTEHVSQTVDAYTSDIHASTLYMPHIGISSHIDSKMDVGSDGSPPAPTCARASRDLSRLQHHPIGLILTKTTSPFGLMITSAMPALTCA